MSACLLYTVALAAQPARAQPAPTPPRAQATYSPTSGLRLQTSNGQTGLRLRTRLQLRQPLEDPQGGLTQRLFVRRARIDARGHLLSEANRWRVQLGLSPTDLGATPDGPTRSPILDAYWELRPDDGPIALRIGRHKVPITRLRVASSASLQFVDRHSVDGAFTLDRDTGALLESNLLRPGGGAPRLRTYLGIYQGGWQPLVDARPRGMRALIRHEVFPLGAFRYHAEGDLERSTHLRVGLGAAVVYVDEDPSPADPAAPDPAQIWTLDTAWRWHGLSLDGVISNRSSQPSAGSDEAWGWSLQAGTMLPGLPLGLAARIAEIDAAPGGAVAALQEQAGAASWFIAGHDWDLTADLTHRTEPGVPEHAWIGRLQLELTL